MSPINIPIKPPPRVNTANGVNGNGGGSGGDSNGERVERESEKVVVGGITQAGEKRARRDGDG